MPKRYTLRDRSGRTYSWSAAELPDTLFESEAWDKASVKRRVRALGIGESVTIKGETLTRTDGSQRNGRVTDAIKGAYRRARSAVAKRTAKKPKPKWINVKTSTGRAKLDAFVHARVGPVTKDPYDYNVWSLVIPAEKAHFDVGPEDIRMSLKRLQKKTKRNPKKRATKKRKATKKTVTRAHADLNRAEAYARSGRKVGSQHAWGMAKDHAQWVLRHSDATESETKKAKAIVVEANKKLKTSKATKKRNRGSAFKSLTLSSSERTAIKRNFWK